MAQKYFETFPLVTYSNTQAVDITKRTTMMKRVSDNPYVFYPYEITSNERADQLSARYYEDQYKSWMIYLVNNITDPYFEWYMSEKEFSDFLTKKYGTYYDAQTKISFYRNDWVGAENITVSAFNALPDGNKKYWEPTLGSSNRINGYKRKEIDWKVTTNKIISYTANTTTFSNYTNKGTNFIKDEICNIVFDDYNIGRGQIASASNTEVFVKHVSGAYFTSNSVSITSNSYIYGTESKVNTKFISVYSCANNIPDEEVSYWTPVTYYEYENEKNEFNKTIRVLDSDYKQSMVDSLKTKMKE